MHTADTDTSTIVIVDDEQMVLTSLNAFFALETDYRVVDFTSAEQALQYIRENEIDLVISDQMMPEMDGITFLRAVRKLQPAVPRYLLTGYADKANAIAAINQVALDKYIEKPWDNTQLAALIDSGLRKRNAMKSLDKKMAQLNTAYQELLEIDHGLRKTHS